MAKNLTIIGNWKMHGSEAQIAAFLAELQSEGFYGNNKIVICPPAVYLAKMAQGLLQQGLKCDLGAQDVSAYPSGAYTGQISAQMLVEQGCRYVIVGHSERRQYNRESDLEIAQKFMAAKLADLIPILCVGETQHERESDLTKSIIVNQLSPLLKREGARVFENAIIAYEPVWAIGTGLTATPEQAQSVHALIRTTIGEYDPQLAGQVPILYGGSVKSSNAAGLFSMQDIDGALVGGASLQAKEFLAICEVNQG